MVRFTAVWLVDYCRPDAVYFHLNRRAYFCGSKTFQASYRAAFQLSILQNNSMSCLNVRKILGFRHRLSHYRAQNDHSVDRMLRDKSSRYVSSKTENCMGRPR